MPKYYPLSTHWPSACSRIFAGLTCTLRKTLVFFQKSKPTKVNQGQRWISQPFLLGFPTSSLIFARREVTLKGWRRNDIIDDRERVSKLGILLKKVDHFRGLGVGEIEFRDASGQNLHHKKSVLNTQQSLAKLLPCATNMVYIHVCFMSLIGKAESFFICQGAVNGSTEPWTGLPTNSVWSHQVDLAMSWSISWSMNCEAEV